MSKEAMNLPPMPECDKYCGDCAIGEAMWTEDQMRDYAALAVSKAMAEQPAQQQEPVAKVPGMAVQALAGEIVEALLADDKDGGYDLTAGMFGRNFSTLVRRWAQAEWASSQPAQQEPTDSMGIPVSCGKPFCSPGDHHPLCKIAERPAPVQQCMNHGECFGGKCIYPAQQPAQQEPVACANGCRGFVKHSPPAQRKPLTPAEVHGMAEAHGIDGDARHWYVVGLVDAQAKHNIKEQP